MHQPTPRNEWKILLNFPWVDVSGLPWPMPPFIALCILAGTGGTPNTRFGKNETVEN